MLNFNDKTRALVIAPHTDDEVLGCGITIRKLLTAGAHVTVVLMSGGGTSKFIDGEYKCNDADDRFHEFQRCLSSLCEMTEHGRDRLHFRVFEEDNHHKLDTLPTSTLVGFFESCIQTTQATLVLTPFAGYDQDHCAVNTATKIACRPHFYGGCLWEYTAGTEDQFVPNLFVVGTARESQHKLDGFACYKTQQVEDKHRISLKAVEDNTRYWGRRINKDYAEAFNVVRSKVC